MCSPREETVQALIMDILSDLERAEFHRVIGINVHGELNHGENIMKAFGLYNAGDLDLHELDIAIIHGIMVFYERGKQEANSIGKRE